MKAAGMNALESVKETVADVAASARSGLEKTKAILQEKEKSMSAHNNAERAAAKDRKEERLATAELNKQLAMEQNAVQRAANTAHISTTGGLGLGHPDSGSLMGGPGYTTGSPQMSAVPPQPTRDAT